ncbi:hypothetical protein IE4872_PB00124 (plasmid) [Rhizobium gallicum]|uniref:Uncharacterized protein n=2 Tax=Rhizobium TaxID=379 RepID=A0A1L5NQ01_9HYPH|nr:hypothetical protein IE4872_PB00124 [Rhizobium gallicum]TCU34752.1 hypothetical protein EV129_11162 [Rhizobium azibense]
MHRAYLATDFGFDCIGKVSSGRSRTIELHVHFNEHRSTNDLARTCDSSIESTGFGVPRCFGHQIPLAFSEFGRTLGSLTAGRGSHPNIGKIIADFLGCLIVM